MTKRNPNKEEELPREPRSDDDLRWALRYATDNVRESEMGRADEYLLNALEVLAEKLFGPDWRPLYDWERRNR